MLLGKTIVITGISSGIGARVGELAQALGADIIGVDINEPTRPLDAFIKADIGSAQGVAEIMQTLPQRFDALCNVAGVSGMIGAARTKRAKARPALILAGHGVSQRGRAVR
jgi:NAD(P)-dependent dehydrogenase (short-subunit alcohol dehydrogenase family)